MSGQGQVTKDQIKNINVDKKLCLVLRLLGALMLSFISFVRRVEVFKIAFARVA